MNYKVFLKAVLFAVLSALIAMPLQVLNSMFVLHQGRPENSFLIPIGIISITMKSLFAISYILMGQKLPIKNSHFKAFAFIVMIWISDYLPQIFGIAGADGPLAKAAFNIPIVACDSFCYILDGILLGFIFKCTEYHKPRFCTSLSLIKTSVVSAIMFPFMVFIFDQILGHIGSQFYCYNAMQVSKGKIVIFDVIFYGCLAITGVLLPVFYRLTEYNDAKEFSARRFGIIYSLCIWAPVVMIVIAFGASISITFLYVIVFSICILLISLMNGKLLEYFNSNC